MDQNNSDNWKKIFRSISKKFARRPFYCIAMLITNILLMFPFGCCRERSGARSYTLHPQSKTFMISFSPFPGTVSFPSFDWRMKIPPEVLSFFTSYIIWTSEKSWISKLNIQRILNGLITKGIEAFLWNLLLCFNHWLFELFYLEMSFSDSFNFMGCSIKRWILLRKAWKKTRTSLTALSS